MKLNQLQMKICRTKFQIYIENANNAERWKYEERWEVLFPQETIMLYLDTNTPILGF